MILFPNAKINIGLNILSKREDGYHNLETIFYPIAWKDSLEIIKSNDQQFSSSGISIPGDGNLCQQAYDLLDRDFGLESVHIHLHKNIPIGAGLGGGSSDAAFTLMGLNEMFDLKLSSIQLKEYALKLGADCPFFIDNKACLAKGIGEELTDVVLNISNVFLIVATPDVHISTAMAYSGVVPQIPEVSLQKLISEPMTNWSMKNDFEEGIFRLEPKIKALKDKMLDHGAIYCSMSGSGSSVFAFFDKKPMLHLDGCSVHLQEI
ncbi:MAG: 4-(cytidine 5'-diphospho)-2-C-methyl-D-erythritol kinase [Flavobacteriales bacterium]